MKAPWLIAVVLVFALSASSVVEAGAGSPTERISSLAPLQNITTVTAGEYHTCALTAGGGVKCWGENSGGELGDGTFTDRGTPVDVVGLGSGVTAIAAGGYHTCALTAGGGVKCWGNNGSGRLGDGSTGGYRTTPVDVVGLASGVAAIAAGGSETCALTAGGGVKCWGYNWYGQVGDGTTTSRSTPVDVVGLGSGATAIAVGYYHACAVLTGGGVRCWGYNGNGQLGDGTTTQRVTPVDVVGLASPVGGIRAGKLHNCAVTTGNAVKCWGSNGQGQLGDGTTTQRNTPVDVVGLGSGVAAIAAGYNHTCGLTVGGGLKCWGRNFYGQLGDGTMSKRITPVNVVGLSSGVTAVAAGQDHTCAVAVGRVKCWGYNGYGQLGDGTSTQRNIPLNVVGLTSGVAAVGAGGDHTCALTTGGGVKCWGYNPYGQLGDGTDVDRGAPVDVVGLASGVAALAIGSSHTCALMGGGGVKCWGYNGHGELGDGTTTDRSTPVDVIGLGSGATAIAAGYYHACALLTGGGVKCWGDNSHGEVGDGTTTNRSTPADVVGLGSGVAGIASGGYHTCAVTAGGGAKCWGYNNHGQLGDGTNTDRSTPVDVLGLVSGVAAISAGGHDTCVLTLGGGAKCWGDNGRGQLGDSTHNARSTPADVVGLGSGVAAIAPGGYHTCAVSTVGQAKCWGYNWYGELGDGTTTDRSTPADVAGLASGATGIAAATWHTCAVAAGGAKCWGWDGYGQLGLGTVTYRTTPVDVIALVNQVYLPLVLKALQRL